MNELPRKLQDRATRRSQKRDEKKRQISESAIEALKELGYANTSLRDIAEKSDLSLGMLHYYFEDKTDLILYCVRAYKEEFVHDFMGAIEKAKGREQVIDAFAEALSESIIDDNATHRLWYDIRTQAMFDATFRETVEEIEERLVDIVRFAFQQAGAEMPEEVELSYAMLEGAFRFVMQDHLHHRSRPRSEIKKVFVDLLSSYM